jgi:hypothetical protein
MFYFDVYQHIDDLPSSLSLHSRLPLTAAGIQFALDSRRHPLCLVQPPAFALPFTAAGIHFVLYTRRHPLCPLQPPAFRGI